MLWKPGRGEWHQTVQVRVGGVKAHEAICRRWAGKVAGGPTTGGQEGQAQSFNTKSTEDRGNGRHWEVLRPLLSWSEPAQSRCKFNHTSHCVGHTKSICKSLYAPLELENGSYQNEWAKAILLWKGGKVCECVCTRDVCAVGENRSSGGGEAWEMLSSTWQPLDLE